MSNLRRQTSNYKEYIIMGWRNLANRRPASVFPPKNGFLQIKLPLTLLSYLNSSSDFRQTESVSLVFIKNTVIFFSRETMEVICSECIICTHSTIICSVSDIYLHRSDKNKTIKTKFDYNGILNYVLICIENKIYDERNKGNNKNNIAYK